jgi:hypothetical protein
MSAGQGFTDLVGCRLSLSRLRSEGPWAPLRWRPAAKAFYSGLVGWEADDMPVGDGASTR